MEVMGDSEDMLGAHRGTLSHLSTVVQRSVHDVITRWAIKPNACLCAAGWVSSSCTFVSNDRDKLRLLPEMERVVVKCFSGSIRGSLTCSSWPSRQE